MSVGRISTFLDIYIERDLENGTLTEKEAQELVDHIVMKFRMVKFARIARLTTSSSPVTRYGQLWKLQVSGQDGRSHGNKERLSVSFTHLRIWDRLRSRTLQFFILQDCLRTSRNMQLSISVTDKLHPV